MREDAIPYYPYEYTMSAVQRERYLLPSIGVVGDKEEKKYDYKQCDIYAAQNGKCRSPNAVI